MKTYGIILAILTVIGIGLTALLITRDEKLDQTVFNQTTESIRNLQNLDKRLLVFLSQSRFNSDFDDDELLEISYQLSEEFSNLRYEALFEEIEASKKLNDAVRRFDDHYASREETLELYAKSNQRVRESIKTLTSVIKEQGNEIASAINTNAFSLLLTDSIETRDELRRLIQIAENQSENELKQQATYIELVKSIMQSSIETNKAYSELSRLETGALLDNIEKAYVNYHNRAIESANQFKVAMIVYGVVLLIALIFFAAKIRRNFLFLEQEVSDRTEEINLAYKELQESQEQLIQSEKMASLGQMVAGVAHEINTPLGYVSSNMQTLRLNVEDVFTVISELQSLLDTVTAPKRTKKAISRQLMKTLKSYKDLEAKELLEESHQLLEDGSYGLNEMTKLVGSLKDFARLDRQAIDHVDVHECVESSLTIASNHIRDNNVTVVREFSKLPKINCIPSKLNQLFLNIITNACQAMSESGGQLTVRTLDDNDFIRINFLDQGTGMNEDTRLKIFDPFFTSKKIGVGTGLGMSIAFKIIEAHKGRIDIDSEIGIGTNVTVILPKS
ncbi:MAG: ATP-binding protein [Gammaproteobacteria bacterium]|nr:ATP-binding protein [Gammaproteobacteria bacterium]